MSAPALRHPSRVAILLLPPGDPDEPAILAAIHRGGHSCMAARHAAEAFRLLSQLPNRPDLAEACIILTGGLSGMSLDQTIKGIRTLPGLSRRHLVVVGDLPIGDGADLTILPRPLQPERLAAVLDAPAAAPPADPTRDPARDRGAILVVDDNFVNATLVCHLVAKHGHAVESIGSGEEAVRRVAAGGVAAIFLDLHMPGMDGFDTARAVRASEKDCAVRVPIVAVTADLHEGVRDRALAAGMDDLLPKPVSVASIATALQRWLNPQAARPAQPAIAADPTPLGIAIFDPGPLRRAEESAPGCATQILDIFLADLDRAHDSLPDLLARGAFLDAQRLVHRVRGSSGTVGAHQLAHALSETEAALRAGDQMRCQRALRSLHASRDLFRTAMEKERQAWAQAAPGLSPEAAPAQGNAARPA